MRYVDEHVAPVRTMGVATRPSLQETQRRLWGFLRQRKPRTDNENDGDHHLSRLRVQD